MGQEIGDTSHQSRYSEGEMNDIYRPPPPPPPGIPPPSPPPPEPDTYKRNQLIYLLEDAAGRLRKGDDWLTVKDVLKALLDAILEFITGPKK